MPKLVTTGLEVGETLMMWNVKEFERYTRGQWWYIIAISLGVICVLYAIFSSNFLFALFVILAAIVLYQQSVSVPMDVPFEITEAGIVLGTRFYAWDELESFTILYQPPEVKILRIATKTMYTPSIQVSLEDMNPIEVRETLLEFLKENTEETDESISDTIARRWKLL